MLYFESVQVFGYSLLHSPPASHVVILLNITNLFSKNNRIEEAIETDIVLGYALASSRRFL